MPPVKPTRLAIRSVVFFLLLTFSKTSLLFAQTSVPDEATHEQILASLSQNEAALKTFKASLEIGFPHPTAPLVQWSHGLVAFQKDPEYLYLKGYHSLVPLYFLLRSHDQKFWLYLPRTYTVYWGENAVLERNPDLDVRLIAGDIIEALAPVRTRPTEQMEWKTHETGYRLILTESDGKDRRELEFDQALNVRTITKYNETGFRTLQITKNDWQVVGETRLPYEVKIKRFVPRPNDVILRFNEIRPKETLEATILDHAFPEDVEYVELT